MNNYREIYNICEGVNVSCIKTNKFKTSRLSFAAFVPLKKETVAVNAVLFSLLERCCMKYPEFSLLNKKLEELYGANIYSSVKKVGDNQVLTISAVCLNDDYAFDSANINLEVAKLMCEMIFRPCIYDKSFRENDILQAKRQVKDTIKSEYNDKKSYAKMRCEELMCADEKFGISKYGKEIDVDNITGDDLYRAWEKILSSAKIEIMILGNNNYEKVLSMFEENFSNIERKDIEKCETLVVNKNEGIKNFEEKLDVLQCKLVMGFRLPKFHSKEEMFAGNLMVELLGGTPVSKLFLNVRESMSLCYYCSAKLNKDKCIVFIESGVEKVNLEKAKDEILKQIEDIKNGNFSQSDLDATKIYLIQKLEKIDDSLSSINWWHTSYALYNEFFTPKEYAEGIKNINADQVTKAAKGLNLDTIYVLTGKGEDA